MYARARPRDVAILEQRHHIVGHGPAHRILKIQDAGIGLLGHQQIARVIVAMHERCRLRERALRRASRTAGPACRARPALGGCPRWRPKNHSGMSSISRDEQRCDRRAASARAASAAAGLHAAPAHRAHRRRADRRRAPRCSSSRYCRVPRSDSNSSPPLRRAPESRERSSPMPSSVRATPTNGASASLSGGASMTM